MQKADVLVTVNVKVIRTPASNQHRPLDKQYVQELAALVKDGTSLPHVDATFDGKSYWLWDGFHRLAAYKEAGLLMIPLRKHPGDEQKAYYLSFKANTTHGRPLTPEQRKKSLFAYLAHPVWGKHSVKKIAGHTGNPKTTVLRWKAEYETKKAKWEAKDGESLVTPGGPLDPHLATPDTQKAQVASSVDSPNPASGPKNAGSKKPTGSLRKGGKATTQTQNKGIKEPRRDPDNFPIPGNLYHVFDERDVFHDLIHRIDQLKATVTLAKKKNEVAWARFPHGQFLEGLQQARRALKFGGPFIVCSDCKGDDSEICKSCAGLRFLTEMQAGRVPKEMRVHDETDNADE